MNDAAHHGIIFLPFLRLKAGCTIAGVEFLPLRDVDGKVPDALQTAIGPLTTILSGYIDRHGESFTNCVVATIPGRGWELPRDDFDAVRWSASLLFLASWACNEYYPKFGGSYVNSTSFRPVGQGFTGDTPTFISVVARRRDGSSWDGGYKHGEFQFNVPLQCSVGEPVDVDEAFLTALDAAVTENSPVVDRLRFALPYVMLANTDDQLMEATAEAILMGSAFEQTLQGDASAYKLAKKFAALFTACGSITVDDAKKKRPGIEIDNSKPEYAAAQAKWWVHQKWIEELYDVRSKAVHKGHHQGRTWGWEVFKHLIMAAWVYPLAVKMLLAAQGHYAVTDADQTRCRTIDKLLAVTCWAGAEDDSQNTVWHGIVSKTKLDDDFETRLKEFLKAGGLSFFSSDDGAP